MSVGYILTQAGLKMGLDPSQTGDRLVLLRFLNEAAQELYDTADVDESLKEEVFQVNGDQRIALPPEIGPLRAMREYTTHVPWHLYDERPRYNQFNWVDRWRSWRMIGSSPIMYPIVNQSVFTVVVPEVETPPIVVTIAGPNPQAANAISTLTMDEKVKTTAIPFMDITSFKKDRVNNYDVTLKDADGTVVSQLPNNMLSMRYRIVDVSLYPWTSVATNNQNNYMEVLYKIALPWLSNDGDEYPTIGYDNIVVNKILQLWAEEQGKAELALIYDSKASRSLARKSDDSKAAAEQTAALVECQHDTLLPRNRPLGPSRYIGKIYY